MSGEVYIVDVRERIDGLYVFATPQHRRQFVNALPDGTEFDEFDEPVNGTKGTAALVKAEREADHAA